jgi:hypothetical protein
MRKLQECEARFSEFHFRSRSARKAISAEAHDLLKREISPASVLVIGGTEETLTLLARSRAAIIAIDRNEERVDATYEWARRERAAVLPLVVDLRYPAPGYGVQNAVLSPALSRLRCELVVALGLIESLVFEQRLRFEQIAGSFAQLASRRLIVDFPEVVRSFDGACFSWFGLDQFVKALERHFRSVRVEAPNLLVCEKTPS